MIGNLSRATLFSFVLLQTGAQAATIGVWNFSGTCLDCPGNGTGTLTVTENTGLLNFAFDYSSAWISYQMTNALAYDGNAQITGSTFTGPPADFSLTQAVPITSTGGSGNPLPAGVHNQGTVIFRVLSNGFWQTGFLNSFNSDFGQNGAFVLSNSTVPEPSSVVLVGAGMALAAWRLRRRN